MEAGTATFLAEAVSRMMESRIRDEEDDRYRSQLCETFHLDFFRLGSINSLYPYTWTPKRAFANQQSHLFFFGRRRLKREVNLQTVWIVPYGLQRCLAADITNIDDLLL